MSKNIGHMCLLTLAMALLSSCLDTDYADDTTLYDDIAITSFYISTANMTHHTTSSTGEDSTYVTTGHSMSAYPFYIDQLRGEIYNVDSLPLGVDATKLLCSVGVKNNALVYILNQAGDSLRLLQTTDSTDFSYHRRLRAYASNGLTYRDYTVRVGVHQESANDFRWTLLGTSATVAALGSPALMALNDTTMLLMGLQDGAWHIYTTTGDDTQWAMVGTTPVAASLRGATVRRDTLYVVSGDSLYASTNGSIFKPMASATGISRLVGQSTTELYATSESGQLMAWTEANGWQSDATDAPLLTTQLAHIATCTATHTTTPGADYALLVANRDNSLYPADTTAVVWRKIVEHSANSDPGKWVMIEPDGYNRHQLPSLAGLAVLAYGQYKVAMGMQGVGACREEAFSRIYVSRDQGITWLADSRFAYPEGFDRQATAFAAAVDANNNIWIACAGTGQVWRGRLNSMGWAH